MQVGVFLDVDRVLTEEAINLQLARLLGVGDELQQLEDAFSRGEVSSEAFGRKLCDLFGSAGFTTEWFRQHADKIYMRDHHDRLLHASENTYLVSSGPSYFMEVLGSRNGIPEKRILCSRYDFDGHGKIARCSSPVTPSMKMDFVMDKARSYDMTIGVGDNVPLDTFLAHCTIKIVMGGNEPDFLNVRDLAPIAQLIRRVQKLANGALVTDPHLLTAVDSFKSQTNGTGNVLIMTPFRDQARYRELILAIKQELAENGLKGWIASDLTVHSQLWGNVQAFLIGCDCGVAILTRDSDEAGDGRGPVYNPNVTAELGYMLAHNKPMLLLKERQLDLLFTDISGFIHREFDLEAAERTVRPAVREWVTQLRSSNGLNTGVFATPSF